MKKSNKILFLIIGILSTIALIFFALFFSLPKIIDSEVIKKRVNAYLSEKTGGSIAVEKSEVRLLPLPHIHLSQVSLSISDKAHGLIQSIEIYPDVWSLIRGTVKFSELGLESPRFTVVISEEEKKRSLEAIEGKMRSVLQVLNSVAPDAILRIQDGKLDLTKADNVVFSFDTIQSKLATSGKALNLSLDCRSNLWDSLSFKTALFGDKLQSSGTVQLKNLWPHALLMELLPEIGEYIGDSGADFSVKFDAIGLREVQAEVESFIPSLILMREKTRNEMKELALKGSIEVGPTKISVMLSELGSSVPELKLSGTFTLDRTSGITDIDLQGESIDTRSIRVSALSFGGDIPVIRTIFNYVQGGKIHALDFHARGKLMGDLGRLGNMKISGKMVGGDIYIAAKDLSLRNVSGDVVISRGILTGKNVKASIGNHHGSKGNVRVGLKGKDALFHLDMLVKADMAELPSLLRQKNLIKNEAILREMDRLSDTRGTAQGRLILGERLDSIHVVTDISQMNLMTRYEPLPYPLTITGGEVFFDEKRLQIIGMDAGLGNSSFRNVTAGLNLDDKADFDISDGKMKLSADELYPWITSYEAMKPLRKEVPSIQGIISISTINLKGPLHHPTTWKYLFDGDLKGVAVDSGFFPGRVEEASGMFRITNDELSLKDASLRVADGTFSVSGTATEFPSDIRKLELSLQGEAGPKVTAWISQLIDFSPEMSVRAPVSVKPSQLLWNKDEKTDFDGTLVFGRETQVSLGLTKTPDELSVHDISIKDRDTDVTAKVLLNKNMIDVIFKGILASSSLKTIFADNSFADSSLEGDFRMHVVLNDPKQSVADGTLRGKNLQLPRKYDMPLVLHNISLKASGRKVHVGSAEFSLGEERFSGKGTIDTSQDFFLADMDLFSEGFDWETMEKIAGGPKKTGGTTQSRSLQDIPLQGTIRLRSDSFSYRQFRWEPLYADVSFDRGTIRIRSKKAALCGISTTGDVDITPEGAEIDIALSAKNLQFQPTVLCISDKKADITGKFSMKADIKAKGKLDTIAKSLNGSFSISAKKGKIFKSQTLDKTLDLVNKTENVKGALPDLNKTIIEYRSFTANGTIKKQMLEIEESMLDSSAFGIVAQGKVDLFSQTLDFNALVAPLNVGQRIVQKVPILGHLLGGSLVSIPVKIEGKLSDPQVNFLSPSAIGSAFLGVIKRTIKLPISIIEPVLPRKSQ